MRKLHLIIYFTCLIMLNSCHKTADLPLSTSELVGAYDVRQVRNSYHNNVLVNTVESNLVLSLEATSNGFIDNNPNSTAFDYTITWILNQVSNKIYIIRPISNDPGGATTELFNILQNEANDKYWQSRRQQGYIIDSNGDTLEIVSENNWYLTRQ